MTGEPASAYAARATEALRGVLPCLQRRALGLKPWQTVYGMYDGVPFTDRTNGMLLLPDTIIIFQEPLERDFGSAATLREQVRRTLLHEIAHLFGISDDRLRELGAY